MRKRIVGSSVIQGEAADLNDSWLDLELIATIEVTSEDPHFPVEAVLSLTAVSAGALLRMVNSNFGSSSMNPRHYIVCSSISSSQRLSVRKSSLSDGHQLRAVHHEMWFGNNGLLVRPVRQVKWNITT
jgi:hypothetical protein